MVKGLFRVEEFLHIKRWVGFLHGCQALDWTGQGCGGATMPGGTAGCALGDEVGTGQSLDSMILKVHPDLDDPVNIQN